jgi:hypothetical protein
MSGLKATAVGEHGTDAPKFEPDWSKRCQPQIVHRFTSVRLNRVT